MAGREETLLFIVDIHVRGAKALAALDAQLTALDAARADRLQVLDGVARSAADSHTDLATAIDAANVASSRGSNVVAPAPGGNVSRDTALWGVRGPRNPGSKINPLSTAAESGASAGLGELAASTAAGQASSDTTPVAPVAPTPSPSDKSWLSQAAEQVAAKVMAPEDDRVVQAIQAAAGMRRNVGANPLVTAAEAVRATQVEPGMLQAIQAVQSARGSGGGGGAPETPIVLTAAQAASRLKMPVSRVREMASAGALAGTSKQGGQWSIPEQAVIDMMAAGGGGTGGGSIRPTAAGGGGGNNNLSRKLLWGSGMFGLASMGTLGSFAGFGPEHALMTLLGLAGSATSAVGGAGLLGLGALGVGGVGMGTDLAGIGQAAGDTKSVFTVLNQYQTAQQALAKQLPQTAAAQKALNTVLAGFSPIARKAVTDAALTATQFHWLFNQATGQAEATGAQILTQAMQVGEKFLPILGKSAAQNMGIIKTDLQPLFAWLGGPEGMQIFQNLESEFTNDLPTGIHAFTQGLELLLRVMNIASTYTGGFTRDLNNLFTRLNGESNIQLGAEVEKLVDDFRLWESFIKAIGHDLHALFTNDAGTGNSIIAELTEMLVKLGDWETSVAGRQSLMTIFTVHKKEIDQLLQVIPLLMRAFSPVYMALAPALTTAFTAVAKAVLSVVRAIESIPGGTWLVGLTLIAAKIGVLAKGLSLVLGVGGGVAGKKLSQATVGDLAGAVNAGGGATVAEGAAAGGGAAGAGGLLARIGATGVGSAIGGGAEAATLGVAGAAEGAGFEGLATAIAGAGAAVAPIAAGLIPLLAAAGGVYGLVQLFSLLSGSSQTRPSVSGNQLAQLLQQKGPAALSGTQGAPAPAKGLPFGGDTTTLNQTQGPAWKQALEGWVAIASSGTKLSQESLSGLEGLDNEGKALAQHFPQYAQEIDRYLKGIGSQITPLQNMFKLLTARWNADSNAGLAQLVGTFQANVKRISTVLGLTSAQGKQAVAAQVKDMIAQTTLAMADGRVSVAAGLAAINAAVHKGVADQAISWQTGSKEMLTALESAYDTGLISGQTFYSDLRSITKKGLQNITADEKDGLAARIANVKRLYAAGDDGMVVDQQQLNAQLHGLRQAANKTETNDLMGWVSNMWAAMSKSGTLTGAAMQLIIKELNKAMSELGGAKLAVPSIEVLTQGPGFNSSVQSGSGYGLPKGATGMRVNAPMYMVGEESGHEEYVLATNPAYRQRNLGLWAEAGHALGIPGFAAGGMAGTITGPKVSGAGALAELVHLGVADVLKAANAFLDKHTIAAGGGGKGGVSASGLSGSLVQIVQQISKRLGWGGQVQDWLNVISRESGGSMTARNPSGAYGIAQFINGPGEYAQYGGNVNTMSGQLVAMANYIKQRYGTPAAAWAHELADNFYAKGGKVDFAGGFAGGGMVTANRPTMAVFGENGDETAMFIPHYKTGGVSIAPPPGFSSYSRSSGGAAIAPPSGASSYSTLLADLSSKKFAGWVKDLIALITAEGTAASNVSSLDSLLMGLNAGTSLKSLGLTGSALKALGLSRKAASSLIGGGAGSYTVEIKQLDDELAKYKQDQSKLKSAYQEALDHHNKTLSKTILGELNAVDQAIATTITNAQQALVSQITAKGTALDNVAQAKGNAYSILQLIESLPVGTNLSALGLTPAVLKAAGLSGNVSALLGTAGTTAGTNAENSSLEAEIAAYDKELSYDESKVGKLHGSAKTSLEATIQGLIQTLLGLQGDINTNSQALAGNTSATTSNTGAMTGSVSFSYNSQQYLASDTPMSLGVGT